MAKLRLRADRTLLPRARSFALDQAGRLGLPEEGLGRLDLILEEVFLNAAEHAYGPDQGEVELECGIDPDSPAPGFFLRLTDWAGPFNPLDQDEPDLEAPLEERGLGGLGLVLLRGMSDHARYEREQGSNILTIYLTV